MVNKYHKCFGGALVFTLVAYFLMYTLHSVTVSRHYGQYIDTKAVEERCHRTSWVSDGSFLKDVAVRASKEKVIMLALIDSGFLDMVINFYITSIKAHGIENYIILSMDSKACVALKKHGIYCAMYHDFGLANSSSRYGTKEFRAKMDVRAEMMERILCAGYTVLHVDTDLFFFSNPLLDIDCQKESCHMATLMDGTDTNYNAGFIYLHPNNFSLYLYQQMQHLAKYKPEMTEQERLVSIIRKVIKEDWDFKIQALSRTKYVAGNDFYGSRVFAETAPPCDECIVVHNNWIIGMHEKVLRAKELHQWKFDKNGYYSDLNSKYLTYDNPQPEEHEATTQLRRLQRAFIVGELLNRTVILPAFFCSKKPCTLRSLTSITNLDKELTYREHSFLTHPLVPYRVKLYIKGPYNITDASRKYGNAIRMSHTSNVTAASSSSSLPRVDASFIERSYSPISCAILRVASMDFDITFQAPDDELEKRMQDKFEVALKIN